MTANQSGLTNNQQALLVTIAFVLASAGTFTSLQGAIKDVQWQEIIGIVAIMGGIASAAIKEYLGALGINLPSTAAQLTVVGPDGKQYSLPPGSSIKL